MAAKTPMAFMSYVRFDDEHENGRLTEFRQRLASEVRMQTGKEFPIFQDRNDIKWGQNWKQRIDGSLDAVTFLIVIVTPSFFQSPSCRDEVEKFLLREQELGRDDLILPVYYVDCPVLNDAKRRSRNKVARAIASHQYVDWRDLRFEPLTSREVGTFLAQMAVQIRDALEPITVQRENHARRTARSSTKDTKGESAVASELIAAVGDQVNPSLTEGRPVAKNEPPTHVVDAMSRGQFITITEAIHAANPGDRILVRPGLYQEGLVIDKPLEILGDGPVEEIVVQATGKHAVLFKTTMGRIANLTIRQMGGGNWYAVDIGQGRLDLERCDITGQNLVCVSIYGGADPHLRRNRIHDGNGMGVFIHTDGQGTLEDNDIFGNASSGILISGGNPTVRRNRIHDGKHGGVLVYQSGRGALEDNDIFGNALAGISISEGGNPALRRNRINNNGYEAIWIYKGGGGTFEDNDLRNNARGAWDISADSEANVHRARNQE